MPHGTSCGCRQMGLCYPGCLQGALKASSEPGALCTQSSMQERGWGPVVLGNCSYGDIMLSSCCFPPPPDPSPDQAAPSVSPHGRVSQPQRTSQHHPDQTLNNYVKFSPAVKGRRLLPAGHSLLPPEAGMAQPSPHSRSLHFTKHLG